ncbi:NAD(P)/FAD-dependent oxidoreductase [Marivita sp. S2033]|uniref:NAD(P)/FAD-dependent oxidoreductase n=1 Tax=Marivita sp. S2033 TaxID=3373187 RepID=UPI0039826D43
MRRIYEPAAYQAPASCWWHDTVSPEPRPELHGEHRAEVAVIGGGFTGLNAALMLAQSGVQATVIDAEQPGWGASGRNGGFCCLGGAKLPASTIAKRHGEDARREWQAAERAAVEHVAALLRAYGIDADCHSTGETLLAHNAKSMRDIQRTAVNVTTEYGVTPHVFTAEDLPELGLNGAFHGGMTTPIGFALNPAKYHAGLHDAAMENGVQTFGQTPATALAQYGAGWRITTPRGTIVADRIILATNGYSSEDVPRWLRARYLPVQSSVIVTRPISTDAQSRQGWTSTQMCYDSRTLLHYFRLMPDGRFLFGMRGGLRATPKAEAALSRKIRADFHAMFREWHDVEITHEWSGLLCLMRSFMPFAGAVPDMPGVFAAMGYHGNGVAMGSYLGARLADTVLQRPQQGPLPAFLGTPPKRFPLGPMRRALLAPAYAAAALWDS